MAETTRLSVGQAIDKLRGTEAPQSKLAHLNEKIEEANEETRRLKATRLSLERSQQTAAAGRDAHEAGKGHIAKLGISSIIVLVVIVIAISVWAYWIS